MKFTFVVLLLFISTSIFSKNITMLYMDSTNTVISSETIDISDESEVDIKEEKTVIELDSYLKKPNPVFQLFKKKQRLNKRITSAVLAFPFPFGIVGLHRIYLGTKPYVPVAYIATFGGVFGILPFIDFCAITFDKDFNQYRENGKIFMWIKD